MLCAFILVHSCDFRIIFFWVSSMYCAKEKITLQKCDFNKTAIFATENEIRVAAVHTKAVVKITTKRHQTVYQFICDAFHFIKHLLSSEFYRQFQYKSDTHLWIWF